MGLQISLYVSVSSLEVTPSDNCVRLGFFVVIFLPVLLLFTDVRCLQTSKGDLLKPNIPNTGYISSTYGKVCMCGYMVLTAKYRQRHTL